MSKKEQRRRRYKVEKVKRKEENTLVNGLFVADSVHSVVPIFMAVFIFSHLVFVITGLFVISPFDALPASIRLRIVVMTTIIIRLLFSF